MRKRLGFQPRLYLIGTDARDPSGRGRRDSHLRCSYIDLLKILDLGQRPRIRAGRLRRPARLKSLRDFSR